MTRRFLLDVMLGSLATYLRMCGYDAAYALDRGVEADAEVLELAREEDRQLLTRDVALADATPDAILFESTALEDQLRTLRDAGVELDLDRPRRCSRCNGILDPLESGTTPDYAPDPGNRAVWRCGDCSQCYWRGSHWEDVTERLDSL